MRGYADRCYATDGWGASGLLWGRRLGCPSDYPSLLAAVRVVVQRGVGLRVTLGAGRVLALPGALHRDAMPVHAHALLALLCHAHPFPCVRPFLIQHTLLLTVHATLLIDGVRSRHGYTMPSSPSSFTRVGGKAPYTLLHSRGAAP